MEAAMHRQVTVPALALGLALATAPARADDACMSAHEAGQRAKAAAQLTAARALFLTCARPSCPPALARDCGAWLEEVERLVPTVVASARDKLGRDMTDVRVSVDQRPFATVLDGKALPLDPGAHVFRFEHAEAPAVELTVLVREGDKGRTVEARFDWPEPGEPAPRPVPPAIWVLGGLGLVQGTVAGVLATSAAIQRADLDDRGCAPACPRDEAEAIDRSNTLALVLGGFAAATLAAAVVLFVARPDPSDASPPPSAGARPRPRRRGIAFAW
jgi:hypothetical protein